MLSSSVQNLDIAKIKVKLNKLWFYFKFFVFVDFSMNQNIWPPTIWRILIGIFCINSNEAFFIDRELPCQFVDSIDISAGVYHPNNSITFRGMLFPEHEYAKVNYILNDGIRPVIVEPYVRGCPCNIKPCIRLCCPFGYTSPEGSLKCIHNETNTWSTLHSDIIRENNQSKVLDLSQNFGFVERICKLHYYADDFKIQNVSNSFDEIFFFLFTNDRYIQSIVNYFRMVTFCLKMS